jgi:hypothetical protein
LKTGKNNPPEKIPWVYSGGLIPVGPIGETIRPWACGSGVFSLARGGWRRGLGTAFRRSGLSRLFRRFFGIDNRGGRGVLLDRFDAFNTRRPGLIRIACGDDFSVTGFEVEPALFFPVKENFKLCCHLALLVGFDYAYYKSLGNILQGDFIHRSG